MTKKLRRMIGSLLSLVLLLGLTVPALADSEKKPHEAFKDLVGSEWSIPYVAEMQAKGLMLGTGDGKFEPNEKLTRVQAITVAIRLMGLENDALTATVTEAMLPFADVSNIPPWARPYVALAVAKKIVPNAEDGLLRSGERATRLWMSVLLVRALGFDAEAQAKMAAPLPFRDARLVPAALVGYVATTVDHGLVTGFPDETFRPNEPVTRAQAATLLSRSDGQLADLGQLRPGQLQGEVLAVDAQAGTLTLGIRESQLKIAVAANAAIFVQGLSATLAEVKPGAKAAVVIGSDSKAVLVTARVPEGEANRSLRAYVISVLSPAEGEAGTTLISLKLEKGEKTYPLAADVEVIPTEQGQLTIADLQRGDYVEVKLVSGVVTRVMLKKRAEKPEEAKESLKGVISAVVPASAGELAKITIGDHTLSVAPGVEVKVSSRVVTLSDLKIGVLAEVKTIGGVAVRIQAKGEEPREIEGTLTEIRGDGITVTSESGQSFVLTVTAAAMIYVDDQVTALADLQLGTHVHAKVEGSTVTKLKIED